MASVVSPQSGLLRHIAQLFQHPVLIRHRELWRHASHGLMICIVGWLVACDPLPDCYTDQDCGGLTCVSGECVQLCTDSSICEGDDECRGVYDKELDNWSVAPRCEANSSCNCRNSDDTCVEYGSVKACVQVQAACTFRSCDLGYECISTAGATSCSCSGGDCGPRCSAGSECVSGNCSNGRCEPKRCDANDDCNGNTVCVLDVNGRGSCEPRGELGIGQACTSSMLCESGHCTLLDGSTPCQTSCERDRDCDGDQKCARDDSYQASGGGTCVAETVCGDTHRPVLATGTVACGSSERCDQDADCPAPGTCVLGQCTCPTGACEQSCDADNDCQTGLVCLDDVCSLPTECTTSADCPQGATCATNPAEWAAGKHCTTQGSVPANSSCQSSADCASGLCIDNNCELECETTADCTSGECTQRALLNDAFALLCSPVTCACAATEVCLRDGTCAAAQSCLLTSCPDGEACVAGVCRTACDSSAECADGQSCTLSAPDNAYFCAINDCACSENEVCAQGVCLAASSCRLDTDCSTGICIAGQCQTECETEQDCAGRECLATVTTGGTRLVCGTFGCGCGPDSWCDPLGATAECYQGVDCEDCATGYVCGPQLPAGYSVKGTPLQEACQCDFGLECGKPCEDDEQCASGETCSARGTCAPPGVCESNADCDDGQDCVLTQNDVLTAATNARVVGQCRDDACGCSNGKDVCVESDLSSACVSLGEECSVIEPSCDDHYRCDATLGLCICDDPEECGGGCSQSEDCAPDRLCVDGRCAAQRCQTTDDCPDDSICGGPTRNLCVQPGTKNDFEVCGNWFECESAYCFANNTCATPCDNATCEDDLSCEMFEPEEYPNERPICLDKDSACTPACEPGQYCDNAEEPACQPPTQP